ncbi:hypothetical protein [Mariprofundus sp. NF]|nr:hypothetical protein [Mariprofundus sp. NF]
MPHSTFFGKQDHFETSSGAMVWFLSGIAILLFVMLISLIFMK